MANATNSDGMSMELEELNPGALIGPQQDVESIERWAERNGHYGTARAWVYRGVLPSVKLGKLRMVNSALLRNWLLEQSGRHEPHRSAIQARMPPARARVEQAARASMRSLNAELVFRVEQSFEGADEVARVLSSNPINALLGFLEGYAARGRASQRTLRPRPDADRWPHGLRLPLPAGRILSDRPAG